MAIRCKQCDRPLGNENRMASMSGSIIGDECTDSYFLCPACGVYTVAQWWDDFTGVETMNLAGPLPKQEGDERIALIAQCARPWDKKCRCEAHRAYFNDQLD